MSIPAYTPHDWYWIVGGTGPHKARHEDRFSGDESRVYSSARQAYVPSDDVDYRQWQKRMGLLVGLRDPTTRIDTEDNLMDVLKQHGIAAKFADHKK